MKWNISVIGRKDTNKYYESTGEGNCKRSYKYIKYIVKKILNLLLKRV